MRTMDRWTAEENELMEMQWPDVAAIHTALPHRTVKAIRQHGWRRGQHLPNKGRKRGMLKLDRGKGSPIVRELMQHIIARRESGRAFARRSGVSMASLYDWSKGQSPNLVAFEAVCNAAGLDLVLIEKVSAQ